MLISLPLFCWGADDGGWCRCYLFIKRLHLRGIFVRRQIIIVLEMGVLIFFLCVRNGYIINWQNLPPETHERAYKSRPPRHLAQDDAGWLTFRVDIVVRGVRCGLFLHFSFLNWVRVFFSLFLVVLPLVVLPSSGVIMSHCVCSISVEYQMCVHNHITVVATSRSTTEWDFRHLRIFKVR